MNNFGTSTSSVGCHAIRVNANPNLDYLIGRSLLHVRVSDTYSKGRLGIGLALDTYMYSCVSDIISHHH